jgi:acetyl-CoA synthetase (ADP-forming)
MNSDSESKISESISSSLKDGKFILTPEESRNLMELVGIPFNKSELATSEEEAVEMANQIGYPVVMKIVSPQIVHKTEYGGVKLDLENVDEVKKAYNDIYINILEKVPEADIKGISVDKMLKGTELIIGTTIDPQFGQMIMFGIGGIYVEIYQDVSFRLIPINSGDAKDMLNEIKGTPLLEGARGRPKADKTQLVDILIKVSDFVNSNPDIQEMDLNPLLITNEGIVAVDARVILKKPGEPEAKKGLGEMIEEIKSQIPDIPENYYKKI